MLNPGLVELRKRFEAAQREARTSRVKADYFQVRWDRLYAWIDAHRADRFLLADLNSYYLRAVLYAMRQEPMGPNVESEEFEMALLRLQIHKLYHENNWQIAKHNALETAWEKLYHWLLREPDYPHWDRTSSGEAREMIVKWINETRWSFGTRPWLQSKELHWEFS